MKNVLNLQKISIKSILMGSIILFGIFSLMSNNVTHASLYTKNIGNAVKMKSNKLHFDSIYDNEDLKMYWLDKLLFPENKPENKDVETNDRNKKSNEKDIEKRDEEPSKK